MSTQPFQGNQFFSGVQNVSSSPVVSLAANNVTAGSNLELGPVTYTTVIGYTPTAYIGGTTNVFSLANIPNQATTSSGNALTLPEGAFVTRVILTNQSGVSLAGGTTTLATSNNLNAASNAGVVTTVASAVTAANVNIGYSNPVTGVSVNGGNVYVNAVNSAGATGTGSFVTVTITYAEFA